MKKFDKLLKNNPLYFLLFLTFLMALFKILLNVIQRRPIFNDIDSVFFIAGFYLVSWIITKLFHSKYVRVFAAFLATFTYLSVEMFFDDSYVNYTSFIVTGAVAIFIAAMMSLIMNLIDSKNNR
ncbi:hypothetical protein [Weissella paramesenteroides]|mgnify:FL=1|jgi:uncharacterized membrane protein YjjP (DUF1212 family)|uniref:hypothetical protein n=2 Tax=Weissella paramesenteroides TaxID=1249 RepID=UPI0011290B1A|nr:hypothetical protein [Weissella paramesenteroides]MCT0484419.1 hypothetical protein [Weissella paramesenteroides]NFB04017.1 hypothetical protein [Weissella paramesenteroides]TPF02092.1 hypothetical protein DIS13_05865 [Weissella paramesenteroides]WEA53146.1 hypothetical protein PWO95_00885 [Weissella paramesenteroides]